VPGSTPGTLGAAIDSPILADPVAAETATITNAADAAARLTLAATVAAGFHFARQTARDSRIAGPHQRKSSENKLKVGVFHWSLRGTQIELEYGDMQACATAKGWQPTMSDFRHK
jgi:hypothetical protein